jgi:hypothetical protein
MDALLLILTYNLFFVSLSLHLIDSRQTDKKLHTELKNRTTLESKKIDVSETMASCITIHNIAYNCIEEDESRQEEYKEYSSKQEKMDEK